MKPKHLIAIYVTIALITFGYAAASHKPNPCGAWCIGSDGESKTMVGLTSGVAWPLYWTWGIFERILK